jgi:hypothetical protein
MVVERKVLETMCTSCCLLVTLQGLNWLESSRYPRIWATLARYSHSVVIKLHLWRSAHWKFVDIFLVAAKAATYTMLRYKKLKTHGASQGKYSEASFSILMEDWKPVSTGLKKTWWECIALPDAAAFIVVFTKCNHDGMVDKAHALLQEAKMLHQKLSSVTYHTLIHGCCKME